MIATLIYFLVLNVDGNLPRRPISGTSCWQVRDCQWASSKVICAKTSGDASSWLHREAPRCKLSIEVK